MAGVSELADTAIALAAGAVPEEDAVAALVELAEGDRRAVEIARGRCLRMSPEVDGADRAAFLLGRVLGEMGS